MFWLLWFYLWIPLISLVAWLLGVEIFHREMIELEGLQSLLDLLGWYGLTIALLGGFYTGWAVYNQLRFRGKNRRRAPAEVEPLELANAFDIVPALILPLQESQAHRHRS